MPESFNALTRPTTRVLVLGSMPGVASLQAEAYYAHPRNAFWPIMLSFINGDVPSYSAIDEIPYQRRISLLHKAGIGLWDVLASCEREGSLDSAIRNDTLRLNDFVTLMKKRKQIKAILFNGKTAEKLFLRHAPENLHSLLQQRAIHLEAMPSTSPAMASLKLADKAARWQASLRSLL